MQQVAHLEWFFAEWNLAFVEPGEQEQIIGKLGEPVCFLADRAQRGLELFGAAGQVESEVDLGSHERERRA